MAKLIHINGKTEEVAPKNGTDFTLQELYDLIECSTIEICPAKNKDEILIFDEEFLCKGNVVKHHVLGIALEEHTEDGRIMYKAYLNRFATEQMSPEMGPFKYNVICGKAVLCKSSELK